MIYTHGDAGWEDWQIFCDDQPIWKWIAVEPGPHGVVISTTFVGDDERIVVLPGRVEVRAKN